MHSVDTPSSIMKQSAQETGRTTENIWETNNKTRK